MIPLMAYLLLALFAFDCRLYITAIMPVIIDIIHEIAEAKSDFIPKYPGAKTRTSQGNKAKSKDNKPMETFFTINNSKS